MNIQRVSAWLILIALVSPHTFTQSVTTPSTHREAMRLMRTAHAPEQYQALTLYFRAQQAHYQLKAADEKQEWLRRSRITTGPTMKPPTPANSARNLYQYYAAKANEMAGLASLYEQKSR